MHEIILITWYQENPYETDREVYEDMGFCSMEDACDYLGKNYEHILNTFPVESIRIDYNNSRT